MMKNEEQKPSIFLAHQILPTHTKTKPNLLCKPLLLLTTIQLYAFNIKPTLQNPNLTVQTESGTCCWHLAKIKLIHCL